MNQLWVWSTAVQTSSLLMIAVFFAILSRSVRLAEVRIWVWAWACNLYALLVTVAARALLRLVVDHERALFGEDEWPGPVSGRASHAGVEAVITLCAEEVCPTFLGRVWRVHWQLPDPAGAKSGETQSRILFRQVRDKLVQRLQLLFRP